MSTDLASRGLDLPDITAVIQVDFPVNSADFLHRAGRTARAGKSGIGIIILYHNSIRSFRTKLHSVTQINFQFDIFTLVISYVRQRSS